MQEDLKQDLLENAISSLKEGLSKYKNVIFLDDKPINHYKFAILHFTHFIELSLKYHIASLHPLLIYSEPFNKKLAISSSRYEVKTISLDQSLQILKNIGNEIPTELVNDIKFVKIIRNQIMHSKFSFKSDEADEKLGRLIKAFKELNDRILSIELDSWLGIDEFEIFEKLYEGYLEKLIKAKNSVRRSREVAYKGRRLKELDQVNWNCYICPDCKEKTLIPCRDSKTTGYKCAFCGNEESNEIEIGCPACGDHPNLTFEDGDSDQFYCSYHKKLSGGD